MDHVTKKAATQKRNPITQEQKSEEKDGDSETPSPLILLPKELWTYIFNYVPQVDRLKHRFVSKEWCKIIDEFSSVDVNFNADYPPEEQRNRIFELRIRNSTFSSLHEPFYPNFKNPFLVKEITFTTRVAASNVLRILSVCTKVESLRFLTTMSSESDLEEDICTATILNNLKCLKYLEIGILTFLDRNPNQKSRTFSAIIGNSNVIFPSLKTLSVAFLLCHLEWCQMFKFISRHSVTLKSLNAICPCGQRLAGAEKRARDTLIPIDLVLPQLTSIVVNGASDCSCRQDISLLLHPQKQLQRFETDISHSSTFLKDMIANNQGTIRSLKLHEIGTLYSDELNCDLFQNCELLRELSLKFDGGYVLVVCVKGGTSQQHMPVLFNLEALPKSLRKLTLCGSQIPSQELKALFSEDRILEEFTLGRADSLKLKTTGMTISILVTMLKNLKQLKKFRIFLDMICVTECSHEVYYCSELKGIWLQLLEIARELNVVNEVASDENGIRCCGERYTDESCLNHRPFIDLLFNADSTRQTFLERIEELQGQGSTSS